MNYEFFIEYKKNIRLLKLYIYIYIYIMIIIFMIIK